METFVGVMKEPEKWADGVLSGAAIFTLAFCCYIYISTTLELTYTINGWPSSLPPPQLIGVFLGASMFGAFGIVGFHDVTKAPFGWVIGANVLTILFNAIAILSYHATVCMIAALIGISLVMAPGVLSPLLRHKITAFGEIARLDSKVLGIAKIYGGVLTKSVIVYELKITLEAAEKSLDRFCKHREARKIHAGVLTIYDFPSARIHLTRIDNKIVEILRDNYMGISRIDLLKDTGLSIESLQESLKRLEISGIIVHDKMTDEYKLRGVLVERKHR